MKFNLQKSHISSKRLFGFNQIINLNLNSEARILDLISLIHRMNTLQIVGNKYFFSIDHGHTISGPFVEVIGLLENKIVSTSFLDFREFNIYSGIIENDASAFMAENLNISRVFSIFDQVLKKLPGAKSFLSLEMEKIELHFFEQ